MAIVQTDMAILSPPSHTSQGNLFLITLNIPVWSQAFYPPDLASWVPRVIGKCHYHQLPSLFKNSRVLAGTAAPSYIHTHQNPACPSRLCTAQSLPSVFRKQSPLSPELKISPISTLFHYTYILHAKVIWIHVCSLRMRSWRAVVTHHSIHAISFGHMSYKWTLTTTFPQRHGDEGTKVACPVISRGFMYMDFAQFPVTLHPNAKARSQKPQYLRGLNKACAPSPSASRIIQEGHKPSYANHPSPWKIFL